MTILEQKTSVKCSVWRRTSVAPSYVPVATVLGWRKSSDGKEHAVRA